MKKANEIIINALAILFGCLYLFPIYIVVVNSFKNRSELYENILSFPKSFSFEYYIEALNKMEFLNAFKNSLVVTIVSILFIILLGSMTAWMLVRNDHIVSKIIFAVLIATMLIPFQTIMMPLMQVVTGLQKILGIKIIDTLPGLIFLNIGFGASMAVFLYHGFIKSIPVSLEEAAQIDGCSKLGIFFRIIFPMLKPITATVTILDVIWIWNDYLLPSLVLTSKGNRTIPLSTASFFGQFTIQWNMAMAGLTLTIIPVIIFYLVAQKHIVKGIATGSVK